MKGGNAHQNLGKIAQNKHSDWLLVLKKTMRIDKMFIQIVKMSLQDYKAKKGGFARLHPEISLAA